jgi:hypothetical protein
MKNILVVLFAVALLPVSLAFSQNAYFQLGGGYGLSSGSQVLGTSTNSTSTQTNTSFTSSSTSDGLFGSYGEGFKVVATGGVMFSKNLGAELGLGYLIGKKFEETDQSTNTFTFGNTTTTSTTKTTTERSGTALFFAPSFVVAAPMQGITPYAKLGMIIGIPKVKTEITGSASATGATSHSYSEKTEDTGGLALGYIGGAGAVFEAGSNLGFFVELLLIGGSWSPSKNELTEYTVDGADKLADVTDPTKSSFERYKSIDYSDSRTTTSTGGGGGTPPNTPYLSIRHPFGSFGANVGVRITIGN